MHQILIVRCLFFYINMTRKQYCIYHIVFKSMYLYLKLYFLKHLSFESTLESGMCNLYYKKFFVTTSQKYAQKTLLLRL